MEWEFWVMTYFLRDQSKKNACLVHHYDMVYTVIRASLKL
jgi:hypothetical protein